MTRGVKMTETSTKGLARAEEHYQSYGSRARELKAEGSKIIGYLSALGPVEILTAAGAVPFRLKGSPSEAVTKAETHMENIVCPFVRNVFDAALKGSFDYLDGLVIPHLCDSIDRTTDIWSYNLRVPYFHFLNMPHVTDGPSMEFMKDILRIFIRSLEAFTGREITDEALRQSIRAYNENRRLMRDLYALRKLDPPLISGVEMMKVLVAAMSLPVGESSALIKEVTREVRQRTRVGRGDSCRLMLMADQIDDVAVAQIIEGTGAWLVMDDMSIGSKIYWPDADPGGDPLQALAERYLRGLKLPTLVESGKTYHESVETRFGHVRRFIDEFQVDGVILVVYKHCDPYGFEVPTVKSFVESTGTPFLYLEDEYSTATLPRMKTRIEAFLEMIASNVHKNRKGNPCRNAGNQGS
jgi:benzoyl-CoA reductase subunit C